MKEKRYKYVFVFALFVFFAISSQSVAGKLDNVEHIAANKRSALLKIRIYLETDNYASARTETQALYALYPDDIDVAAAYASVLFHDLKYDEAETVYLKMLSGKSFSIVSVVGLAAIYYETGRYRDVVSVAEAYRTQTATNADVTLNYAGALDRLGHRDQADRLFSSVLENNQGNADILVRIAQLMLDNMRNVDAINYYKKALSIQPSHYFALKGLAAAAFDTEPDTALLALEKALTLNDSDYEPDYLLAEFYRKKDSRRALGHYHSALDKLGRITEMSSFERTRKALILSRVGLVDDAISEFEALIAADSENFTVVCEYSEMLIDLKRYKEALKLLNKAKEKN